MCVTSAGAGKPPRQRVSRKPKRPRLDTPEGGTPAEDAPYARLVTRVRAQLQRIRCLLAVAPLPALMPTSQASAGLCSHVAHVACSGHACKNLGADHLL